MGYRGVTDFVRFPVHQAALEMPRDILGAIMVADLGERVFLY